MRFEARVDGTRSEDGYTNYRVSVETFMKERSTSLTKSYASSFVSNGSEGSVTNLSCCVIVVWRRYSQFAALFSTLRACNPHLRFPPFPQKSLLYRFSASVIQERKRDFQRLLDFISCHPCLYQSPEFLSFLQDEDNFDRVRNFALALYYGDIDLTQYEAFKERTITFISFGSKEIVPILSVATCLSNYGCNVQILSMEHNRSIVEAHHLKFICVCEGQGYVSLNELRSPSNLDNQMSPHPKVLDLGLNDLNQIKQIVTGSSLLCFGQGFAESVISASLAECLDIPVVGLFITPWHSTKRPIHFPSIEYMSNKEILVGRMIEDLGKELDTQGQFAFPGLGMGLERKEKHWSNFKGRVNKWRVKDLGLSPIGSRGVAGKEKEKEDQSQNEVESPTEEKTFQELPDSSDPNGTRTQERKAKLSLGLARDWESTVLNGCHIIYGISPTVFERPSDWPPNVSISGYWAIDNESESTYNISQQQGNNHEKEEEKENQTLETKTEHVNQNYPKNSTHPNQELHINHLHSLHNLKNAIHPFASISSSVIQFINSGPKPVFIGFDTSNFQQLTIESRSKFFSLIVKCLDEANLRCFLCFYNSSSVSPVVINEIGIPFSPSIYRLSVNSIIFPFLWLFSYCQAVIHDGSYEFASSSLRAGVPLFLIPFQRHQLFWATLIDRLGIGPMSIQYSQLNSKNFYSSLRRVMTEKEGRIRAEMIGEQIREEKGVFKTMAYLFDLIDEKDKLILKKQRSESLYRKSSDRSSRFSQA